MEAIVSTGADVKRTGFLERLPLQNADLSRLIGAPVLDARNARSTRHQLGVIVDGWKENRERGQRVRIAKR